MGEYLLWLAKQDIAAHEDAKAAKKTTVEIEDEMRRNDAGQALVNWMDSFPDGIAEDLDPEKDIYIAVDIPFRLDDWFALAQAALVNDCTIGEAIRWQLTSGQGDLCEWANDHFSMAEESAADRLAKIAAVKAE